MPFTLDVETPFPITGLPNTNDGHPEIRLELRELKKDKDLWNLYLLGLWEFQKMPQDHFLSYFQIAGIHGLPYEEWPKGDQNIIDRKKYDTGFCTHTSIIFLSWHRPYLVLFEWVLYKAVAYVAEQFSEEEGRSRYMAAAKRFRIPYWDWALSGVSVFPSEAMDSEKVQVVMPASMVKGYDLKPSAGWVSIDNPLYCYRFQKGTDNMFKINEKETTLRWYNKSAPSDDSPESIKARMLPHVTAYSQEFREMLFQNSKEKVLVERNLRERVIYVLQSYDKFAQASSNKWNPQGPTKLITGRTTKVIEGMGFGSIEDFHNSVHVLVSGSGDYTGHMYMQEYSSFDPIFWLHHTNIDRHFTIWQALHDDPNNEDTYITAKEVGDTHDDQTWGTPEGGVQNISTELLPFYKGKDGGDWKFWDSEGVRYATDFGHAYPETQHWKFSSTAEYHADIKRQLSQLYPEGALPNMIQAVKAQTPGSDGIESKMKRRAKILAKVIQTDAPNDTATLLKVLNEVSAQSQVSSTEQQLLAAMEAVQIASVEIPNNRTLTSLAPENKCLEWMFNIKAQKHALGGRYTVHVFLEEVQEQFTSLYAVTPNHVGTFYPFGQPESTGCEKCQQDQRMGTDITGQIPLTIALVERYFAGFLESLQPQHVVEYLKKNLHWRVLDSDGNVLADRSQLTDLLVGVSSNEVEIPESVDQFPIYSPDIILYPEITTRLQGGGRGDGTGITIQNADFGASIAA